MPADTAGGAEGLPTLVAGEGPFIRVHAKVHLQYLYGVESLPARFTRVPALVGVVHEMPPVLSQYVESLPAHFARLFRRGVVNGFVYGEAALELEALVAHVAAVGLARGVHVEVALQVARLFAADLTHLAVFVRGFRLFSLLLEYPSLFLLFE